MRPAKTEPDAAAPSPAPYPTELVRAVVLKNGAHVRIRPIRPDDEPRLVDLYGRLSRYTVYQRFFTVMRRLPPDWAHFFANVDYRRRLALVAERDTPAGVELVGVGRYEHGEETDVLRAGVARGIHRFRAFTLADNYRMLRLLSELTDVRERKTEDGVTAVLFEPRREATTA